jgi:FixJ family two-component response regulator
VLSSFSPNHSDNRIYSIRFSDPLTQDRIIREKQRDIAELRERYSILSVREREVMNLVVRGMLNKQIAAEVGASEATVKNAAQPGDEKDAGCVIARSRQNGGQAQVQNVIRVLPRSPFQPEYR